MWWQSGKAPNHFSVIQSAFRPAGASWQKTENLFTAASDHAENPQVATDSRGNAVAVGLGHNGSHDTIRAVARPAGESWQAPVTLSEVGAASPPRPQLAMDPRGDAVAVWTSYKGSGTKGLIESAIRPAGESWQAPINIATVNLKQFEGEHGGTETDIPYPRVAIDSKREAVAVWYDTPAPRTSLRPRSSHCRRLSPGARASPTQASPSAAGARAKSSRGSAAREALR
jgi:hypothetical protein